MLKKAFLVFLLASLSFLSPLQAEKRLSKKQQVEELDRHIEELKKAKIGLEGKAVKLENQGQRLQFVEGYLQEAKRALNAAAEFRHNAELMQSEIDILEARREELAGPRLKASSISGKKSE